VGDLLYCEALSMLLARLAARFVENVKQICFAEIRQELTYRDIPPDIQTYMEIVRGKKGPLFLQKSAITSPLIFVRNSLKSMSNLKVFKKTWVFLGIFKE
jgi:hypothetical protein